jgi:carbonic anhydrase
MVLYARIFSRRRMRKLIGENVKQARYERGAVIVWCVDDRYFNLLRTYRYTFPSADTVCVHGGAYALSRGTDAEQAFVMGQLTKLAGLHNANQIILMAHKDCDACPDANPDKELKKAAAAVMMFLGKLTIRMVYADHDGLYLVDDAGRHL